jgi:hypothetical protein
LGSSRTRTLAPRRRAGQHEYLGLHGAPGSAERRGQQSPDLLAGARLRHRTGPGRRRRRLTTGDAPVLVEDRAQPVERHNAVGLERVVVVGGAGPAPVHAADERGVPSQEQLDVVDLVAAVVDRVRADGDAGRRQCGGAACALGHRRVDDDSHVGAAVARMAQRERQVGSPQLVHLDPQRLPWRDAVDQPRDAGEDGRVLPQAELAAGRFVRGLAALPAGAARGHERADEGQDQGEGGEDG